MNGRKIEMRALAGSATAQTRSMGATAIPLRRSVRGPARLGVSIIAVFVAGATGWASIAPIASGAIAPGIIGPDGSRRTLQHLEGGIIHDIRARDGDEVAAGQILVVLEETQAVAAHEVLSRQARMLEATQARLVAEQVGSDAILFSNSLLERAASDPETRNVVEGQKALFAKRGDTLRAQLGVLDDRDRQYFEQIGALTAQLESARSQSALIEEELGAKSQLVKQGLVVKPELLRLQRAQVALEGDAGRLSGSIAEVRQRIGETQTQRLAMTAQRAEDVSLELERVRTELAVVSERLGASRDILSRTELVAPIAGKVVNSRFKTKGGVIRSGEPILDIVPTGERLLIDARVAPADIDVVSIGLSAVVHLTAYSSRGLPRIQGTVRDVSADRIVDPNTGQPYFLARVEVLKEDLDALGDEYVLVPGMPADVMIVTGERTLMGYLLEPFMSAFRRGLRET